MKKYRKKKKQLDKLIPVIIIPLLLLIVAWVGFTVAGNRKSQGKTNPPGQTSRPDNPTDEADSGNVPIIPSDKSISAVIKAIHTSDSALQLYDIDNGENLELDYNGTTYIYNRYGTAMVVEQLNLGEIVRIDYDSKTRKIQKIKVDENAWEYKNVLHLTVDPVKKDMKTGESRYQYTNDLVVLNGRNLVDLDTLHDKDILTLKGVGEKVWSVAVTTGHGNIVFRNYDDFMDGSLELGYEIFQQVVPDMEFTMREGSYKLLMQHGTLAVNKYITVLRDDTTVIDMNEYRNEVEKSSLVTFDLNPADADLFIDDAWKDAAEPVRLNYGEYVVKVELEGYETCTRLLTVNQASMTIRIDLVNNGNTTDDDSLTELPEDSGSDNGQAGSGDSDDDNNDDDNDDDNGGNDNTDDDDGETSDNGGSTGPKVDEDKLIQVQNPVGASVYLDGKYMGVAPIQFEKALGEHTIVLKRSGYITKSYLVDVANDGEDALFSFPDLTAQ